MNAQNSASAEDPFVISRVTYELYISLVTLIPLVVAAGYLLLPLPQPMWEVLKITDSINALVLLLDFLVRLTRAPHKLAYLFKGGLLGCPVRRGCGCCACPVCSLPCTNCPATPPMKCEPWPGRAGRKHPVCYGDHRDAGDRGGLDCSRHQHVFGADQLHRLVGAGH